jgi:hypothetical protein
VEIRERARRIVTAALGLATLTAAAAGAADDRLWREQAPAAASDSIRIFVLEHAPATHADYLWREQSAAGTVRLTWSAAHAAPGHALWREQLPAWYARSARAVGR